MDLRGTYKGGGGPDKTILSSAQRHDKERFFVLVTYLRDPRDPEFQITEKARKLGIPYVEVQDGRLLDIKCLKKLNAIISEYKIELIHAHDDKTLLYSWLLKRVRPKLKIAFTCHSFPNYNSSDFPSFFRYCGLPPPKESDHISDKRLFSAHHGCIRGNKETAY